MFRSALLLSMLGLIWLVSTQGPDRALLLNPDHPEMNRRAPERCRVLLDTSTGPHHARCAACLVAAWRGSFLQSRPPRLLRRGEVLPRARRPRGRSSASARIRAISTAWRHPHDSRRAPARLEHPRDGRLRVQGSQRPDDADVHQPDGQCRDARRRAVRPVRAGDRRHGRPPTRSMPSTARSAGGGIRGGKQDRLFAEGNAFFSASFPSSTTSGARRSPVMLLSGIGVDSLALPASEVQVNLCEPDVGRRRPASVLLLLDHGRHVGQQLLRVVDDAVLDRVLDAADPFRLAGLIVQPAARRCRRAPSGSSAGFWSTITMSASRPARTTPRSIGLPAASASVIAGL